MMTVLLEATAAQRPGHDRGIGRYFTALEEAYRCITEVSEYVLPFGTGRASEFAALLKRSSALAFKTFDVFHAPTPYYSAVDVRGRPSIVSILDVIPLDLPAHRQSGLKALAFYYLAARSTQIVTLSNHSAGRIVDLLRVSRDRVHVAPLPPSPSFVPAGDTTQPVAGPFVAMLYDLRTRDPRKRADWLVPIASGLRRAGISIVVAGAGTDTLDIPGVFGLGRVQDRSWASVLRGAQAFVYTSAYEGQGMPPLEAIACGTPVVAMSNTSLPEVIGEAGRLVSENDCGGPKTLVAATVDLLSEGNGPRALYASRCRRQAQLYCTERFIGGVRRAYELALK